MLDLEDLPIEILERIFLRISTTTLLTKQSRVCKKWHGIIFNSPTVKAKQLFGIEKEFDDKRCANEYRKNLYLVKNFRPYFFAKNIQVHLSQDERDSRLAWDPMRLKDLKDADLVNFAHSGYPHTKYRPSFDYEGASWRRMPVTHQPVNKLAWHFIYPIYRKYRRQICYVQVEFELPEGLTMGLLWDLTQATPGFRTVLHPPHARSKHLRPVQGPARAALEEGMIVLVGDRRDYGTAYHLPRPFGQEQRSRLRCTNVLVCEDWALDGALWDVSWEDRTSPRKWRDMMPLMPGIGWYEKHWPDMEH